MSKRKTMDKAQARERRNRLLESAAAAELSITEGVREMRAIAGMTQEDFARHREVSARVIKAIELGQGNPTVATLNRIGGFFGLEVGFVPVKRAPAADGLPRQAGVAAEAGGGPTPNDTGAGSAQRWFSDFAEHYREFAGMVAREILQNAGDALVVRTPSEWTSEALDQQLKQAESRQHPAEDTMGALPTSGPVQGPAPGESAAATTPTRKKRKPRSS